MPEKGLRSISGFMVSLDHTVAKPKESALLQKGTARLIVFPPQVRNDDIPTKPK